VQLRPPSFFVNSRGFSFVMRRVFTRLAPSPRTPWRFFLLYVPPFKESCALHLNFFSEISTQPAVTPLPGLVGFFFSPKPTSFIGRCGCFVLNFLSPLWLHTQIGQSSSILKWGFFFCIFSSFLQIPRYSQVGGDGSFFFWMSWPGRGEGSWLLKVDTRPESSPPPFCSKS